MVIPSSGRDASEAVMPFMADIFSEMSMNERVDFFSPRLDFTFASLKSWSKLNSLLLSAKKWVRFPWVHRSTTPTFLQVSAILMARVATAVVFQEPPNVENADMVLTLLVEVSGIVSLMVEWKEMDCREIKKEREKKEDGDDNTEIFLIDTIFLIFILYPCLVMIFFVLMCSVLFLKFLANVRNNQNVVLWL